MMTDPQKWGSFLFDFLLILLYYPSMRLVQYHLYIEKELKVSLEVLAKKDGRSLNNLINKVLKDYVDKGERNDRT